MTHSPHSSYHFFCEPKIDGLFVSLVYIDGLLSDALTKGDGVLGDSVIDNVLQINHIPKQIKTTEREIAIYGEVFHDSKNSTRNVAAGILRNIYEPHKMKALSFFPHGAAQWQLFDTREALFSQFKAWGFQCFVFQLAKNMEACLDYFENMGKQRAGLSYAIDGVIFSMNQHAVKYQLGHHGSIALKFKPQLAHSFIQKIIFQVSRFGHLTPVAWIDPVIIEGAVIQKITLYNIHYIQQYQLNHGDCILIEKAGDIVPKFKTVLLKGEHHTAIPIPTHCPSCHDILEQDQCVNSKCSEKIVAAVVHFVSRKAINIQGMGEALVRQCVERKWIGNILDIYSITPSQFMLLDKVSHKLTQKIYQNIHSFRPISKDCFLYSLGIPHVGTIMAKRLAPVINLRQKPYLTDRFYELHQKGEKVTEDIAAFFKTTTLIGPLQTILDIRED